VVGGMCVRLATLLFVETWRRILAWLSEALYSRPNMAGGAAAARVPPTAVALRGGVCLVRTVLLVVVR
jgi:hypothetical protein